MTGAADANAIFGGEGDADVRTRGLTGRYAGAVPMRQAGGDALVEITPPWKTLGQRPEPPRRARTADPARPDPGADLRGFPILTISRNRSGAPGVLLRRRGR